MLFLENMEEKENLLDVVEDVISDEDLQQFIFDDNQMEYYNEYDIYISNQYAQC